MKEITKAQEEILQAVWTIKEGAISDIVETLPEPRPAYTTVATVIKVLEKKGYLNHKTYGKTHVYFPVIEQKAYAKQVVRDTVKGFFNGSLSQLVSNFVSNKEVGLQELEELRDMLESEIRKEKKL